MTPVLCSRILGLSMLDLKEVSLKKILFCLAGPRLCPCETFVAAWYVGLAIFLVED